MARVSQSTKGLYNGVSQQAASMRLTNQLEAMNNSYSTLAEGCRKRPPMVFLRALTGLDSSVKAHFIIRSTSERYVVVYGDGDVRAWNIDSGATCTIDSSGVYDKSYLTGDLQLQTIADYTFIINKDKIVRMDTAAPVDTWDGYGYVYISRGVASTTYTVTQGSTVSEYTTGENLSENMDTWKTTTIANQLAAGLTGASVNGSMIRLPLSNQVFSVSDSWGNQAMVGWKDTVQKFEDLPPRIPWKVKVRVSEDPSKGFKSYYVENDPAKSGVWLETRGWGVRNVIDKNTMPLTLINDALNHFKLEYPEWSERIVGDDDTSPKPSFVDNTIKDVFVYRGRLGFISGASVILSKADDFFTFWPETTTDTLDSDPIDQTVTHTEIVNLDRAVAFNEALLIFSDKAQFQMSADGTLTNESSKLDQTTAFECDTRCRPIGVGQSVYFMTPRGPYSGMMEYYVDYKSVSNDAAEITAHIPRYLPENVTMLEGNSNENLLLLWSNKEPSSLYTYKYYWDGDNKVQSSWGKWELFGDKLIGMYLDRTRLYLLVWDDTIGASLQTIDLQINPDTGMDFDVHLDNRLKVIGTYSDLTKKTTWDVGPYLAPNSQLVLGSDVSGSAGSILKTAVISGNKLEAYGDYTGHAYIGVPYTQEVVLSQQYLKVGEGESALSVRLQLGTFKVDVSRTGGFRAEVEIQGGSKYSYDYSPVIGSPTLKVGSPYIRDADIFKFPVRSRSDNVTIKLVNDTHYPSAFQNAEWTGNVTYRSQRL